MGQKAASFQVCVYYDYCKDIMGPLHLVLSMDKSSSILLICSIKGPTFKKGLRTSLRTDLIGSLRRPILMHGNFWELTEKDKKISFLRNFLEN